MDVLPGTDVPVNLFPLKVKSWMTKRLCTVTKNNSQLRGTDTVAAHRNKDSSLKGRLT